MAPTASHLGTDWKDQWARVQRWHKRLDQFRDNLPDDLAFEAKALALDDVFAFYMNCYHLKDWVEKSGAKTKDELATFFVNAPPMQLCRDVANGLKHYRLDTSGKRRPAPVHAGWTTTETTMTVMPPEPAQWYFVGTPTPMWFEMFSTADACIRAWKGFLGV